VFGIPQMIQLGSSMEKKIKKAAALKYRHRVDRAPVLVAKGRGIIAERIIEVAKDHNIPLKRDPALIEVLSELEVDQEIPPELYRAVAEILAYVYKMTKRTLS
jgi:flagellar biosynthesis protein